MSKIFLYFYAFSPLSQTFPHPPSLQGTNVTKQSREPPCSGYIVISNALFLVILEPLGSRISAHQCGFKVITFLQSKNQRIYRFVFSLIRRPLDAFDFVEASDDLYFLPNWRSGSFEPPSVEHRLTELY